MKSPHKILHIFKGLSHYEVRAKLRNQGIRVLTIWECTIKKMIHSEQEEQQIMDKVESSGAFSPRL